MKNKHCANRYYSRSNSIQEVLFNIVFVYGLNIIATMGYGHNGVVSRVSYALLYKIKHFIRCTSSLQSATTRTRKKNWKLSRLHSLPFRCVEIEHGYISYARLSILQYGNETTYHVTHVDCQTYILITIIAYGLKFTTPSLNSNKHFK